MPAKSVMKYCHGDPAKRHYTHQQGNTRPLHYAAHVPFMPVAVAAPQPQPPVVVDEPPPADVRGRGKRQARPNRKYE
jgi:hypothetical protein